MAAPIETLLHAVPNVSKTGVSNSLTSWQLVGQILITRRITLQANNSSSDSEDEDQEAAVDVEEEDFTVQVKGGEIQKMKFENMQQVFWL